MSVHQSRLCISTLCVCGAPDVHSAAGYSAFRKILYAGGGCVQGHQARQPAAGCDRPHETFGFWPVQASGCLNPSHTPSAGLCQQLTAVRPRPTPAMALVAFTFTCDRCLKSTLRVCCFLERMCALYLNYCMRMAPPADDPFTRVGV